MAARMEDSELGEESEPERERKKRNPSLTVMRDSRSCKGNESQVPLPK